MEPLIDFIEKILTAAASQAFSGLPLSELQMHLTPATQDKFGHYQCNSAMKLVKTLKKSPREIAAAIIEKVPVKLFETTKIAGPGFINLTLSKEFLSKIVDQMAQGDRLGFGQPEKRQRIVVEFSSPNIAKEMHVGHLRSTIIGDSIARLFEFLGHDVLRLNHVGDWGTAFGMLITYMKEEVPEVLSGTQETNLPTLQTWYKASKKRFDEDADFKARARLAVVALQGGDKEALRAWETICDISRKAFHEVYDLLDIKLEERGESYYNPQLPKVVEDLEKKGLVILSEGAAYSKLYKDVYYPELEKWIYSFIATYPLVSLAESKKKWEEVGYGNALPLLDALSAYMKAGHHPKEGGFTENIQTWLATHLKTCFTEKYLATLRHVESKYRQEDLTNQARIRAAYSNAELTVERFLHTDSAPEEILKGFSTLGEGMYHLSVPSFSPNGKRLGYHAIGLIINSGKCYILDSNCAIGWAPQNELAQTMGRLITEYTGFEYTEEPAGQVPSFGTRVTNWFDGRANPPTDEPALCSLCKIV